ncbi:response regulator [Microbacterium maritypicum]|uniref:Response regulator n=2 Tax=Microbacterium maritypicum TaxID=33918 RepID=A0ACD4B6V9_MICMQ|nr:response regulator [Microbacterium liquefaciens]MBP5802264.1 response regulator [Microbacterium liquefaciens]UTT53043.1 response regulator [Microbacterium liquefaciens]WEF21136.1 response regulator [Microbacterium liquefaciens]
MYVSVEVITMLATAVTLLVAIISGFGWMINRMDARFAEVVARFDARFEAQDAKLGARFEAQDARFDARFEAQDAKFGARFDRIEQEIVEVKIAIARLEGPAPRLIAAR